jgi:hypothetical protein
MMGLHELSDGVLAMQEPHADPSLLHVFVPEPVIPQEFAAEVQLCESPGVQTPLFLFPPHDELLAFAAAAAAAQEDKLLQS